MQGLIAAVSLLLFSVSIAGANVPSADDWKVVGTEHGIIISRKVIPGSRLFAYKAQGILEAPLSKLLSVIRDVPRQKEWVNRMADVKVLKELGSDRRVVYTKVDTPWPLMDRDFVFESTLTLDEKAKTVVVDVRSIEDPQVPESDCCVRGRIHFNRVRLTALDGRRTEVEAEAHVDPRGSIPAWIVNRVQRTFPNKTLRGLLTQVSKPDIADASDLKNWQLK